LVDETNGALDGGPRLDRALGRYRRKFLWRLGPHHLQMADFSTRREFTGLERLALGKAAIDPAVARTFGEVLTRERSVLRLMDPRFAVRVLIPKRRATQSSRTAWQSSPVA